MVQPTRLCTILVLAFILTISITPVKPQQQNDDMEEAELSPNPVAVSDNNKTALLPSTLTTTTLTTTTLPTDKPYPHNILRTEVYPEDSTNNSCIIFQGAIQLYLNSSLLLGKHAILKLDVPINANTSGNCGNLTQTLMLDWNDYESQKIQRGYSLVFQFGFGTTDNNQYDIQEVILYVTTLNATAELKELIAAVNLDAKGPFDPVDLLHSYLCVSNSVMAGSNLTMLTSSLQFEAFRSKSAIPHKFSLPQVCSLDNSTVVTAIGIVVGSVFVFLIAIAFGVYVGFRYGYCDWPPCCNRSRGGYQRLDI